MSLIPHTHGVIMRIGEYDVTSYRNKDLRSVHPTRRDEAIGFRIEKYLHPLPAFGMDEWKHETYKFTYRFMSRTFSTVWHCGELYGDPDPWDGLVSASDDASSVMYDAFSYSWAEDMGFDWETDRKKAEKMYNQCYRMAERLNKFFGPEYDSWARALERRFAPLALR